jgi:hypothetical protein
MSASETLAEAQSLLKMPIRTLESEIDQAFRSHFAKSAKATGSVFNVDKMQTAGARIRLIVEAKLADSKFKIHQTVCVRLKYCERAHNRGSELIVDLADVVAIWFSGIPIPALRVAAYLVRKKMLNPYCNCEDKERKPISKPA